jgi:hypothetical protein
MIVPVQSHAFADEFENVDDAERPVALVRAELAMLGMVDRHQRVNAGIARRLKFPELQLALIRRKDAEAETLQADRRLFQVNKLDTWDRLQDFDGGRHRA